MKQINIVLPILAILTVTISSYKDIYAQNLKLAENEYQSIKQFCPECLEDYVMICGNSNIGVGKKFRTNFFQGSFLKGFLITPPVLYQETKTIIRNEMNYDSLKQKIFEKFSKLKLVVINDSFSIINLIENPKVDVHIPVALYDCLRVKEKKWGCGIANNQEQECCEKKLGSPIVLVTWEDKTNNETVELRYIPDMGSTKLIRYCHDKKIIYYCLNSDSVKITK